MGLRLHYWGVWVICEANDVLQALTAPASAPFFVEATLSGLGQRGKRLSNFSLFLYICIFKKKKKTIYFNAEISSRSFQTCR